MQCREQKGGHDHGDHERPPPREAEPGDAEPQHGKQRQDGDQLLADQLDEGARQEEQKIGRTCRRQVRH
ncbi:hypothetical protein D3C80_2130340 [compost metagenome]